MPIDFNALSSAGFCGASDVDELEMTGTPLWYDDLRGIIVPWRLFESHHLMQVSVKVVR